MSVPLNGCVRFLIIVRDAVFEHDDSIDITGCTQSADL